VARWDTFTFRVNKDDKQIIAILAKKLQRSQSDAIRVILHQEFERRGLLANEPKRETKGAKIC
jgi:hypothetical protein